ncbi:MAG: APC family permease [Ignavibacteriae bacterium]|nr:APC family permease [Ignavibacteriota bacterium]NOG99794.1 APC family permease [Ignavibacteriota bacterium]
MKKDSSNKLTLIGSISLGTGVMIGAGIFALMGQVAELAGNLFPIAFLVGGIVTGLSAYSYVKFSNAYPSSGGVAKFLGKAYGPGTITGTFSLLMYVSMVIAESLVARTFGSYTLRLFNVGDDSALVPILGVVLIAAAFIINISGNKIIGASATITAIAKILGIALLAIAGLAASGFPSFENLGTAESSDWSLMGGFIAALALSILAYKGFTTITNQGDDIVNPNKNVGRSIIFSVLICMVIYVSLALSVSANLSIPDIIEAKNYSLAEASQPVFGNMGLWFTVILAIIATVSGLIASVFSASRLLAMLSRMKQIPALRFKFSNPSLLLTVSLAIILTILFDLTRIAAIGAIFYIVMDIAVHWGLFRFLRKEVSFNPLVPLLALLFDTVILIAFIILKFNSDPLVLVVSFAGILIVIVAERLFMKTHTDSNGKMNMEMDMKD